MNEIILREPMFARRLRRSGEPVPGEPPPALPGPTGLLPVQLGFAGPRRR